MVSALSASTFEQDGEARSIEIIAALGVVFTANIDIVVGTANIDSSQITEIYLPPYDDGTVCDGGRYCFASVVNQCNTEKCQKGEFFKNIDESNPDPLYGCSQCQKGEYSNQRGLLDSCKVCVAGSFGPNLGRSIECTPCEGGEYAPLAGSTTCLDHQLDSLKRSGLELEE